jgi:heme A synthase
MLAPMLIAISISDQWRVYRYFNKCYSTSNNSDMADVAETKGTGGMTSFAKFALFALAYNVVVILWGVFLRASKSGDGCGQYWLTCHGELIPSAPELKTVIEFSHRVTSGIAFFVVIGLVIWAFRRFPKGDQIRKTALGSFAFIITEVIIGGVLVLTGNTAENLTTERPFLAMGHLINSFILLTFLTLTAWMAVTGRRLSFRGNRKAKLLMAISITAIVLVGLSGSLAALSNMLFPSETLVEGIAKDFSETSHMLLRLRLSHPILSFLTSVFVIFVAGWLKATAPGDKAVARWSNFVSILVLAQLIFGAATLLMLAPIIMQVGHLLLADAIWIAFMLLFAEYLTSERASSIPEAAESLP